MEVNDFDTIRISLASPKQIRSWSYGEVLKPETINYRTLRPERDGLFCERIFGPTKDWECYCGKYKRVRYKGIVCDKCGVEVAPSRVRRERMGHIELASPVSHIWYVKGVPSRLGLLLNISPRNLERILYFAQYIITNVDEEARNRILARLEKETAARMSRLEEEAQAEIEAFELRLKEALDQLEEREETIRRELEERTSALTDNLMNEAKRLQDGLESQLDSEAATSIVLNPPAGSKLAAGSTIVEEGEVVNQKHLSRLKAAVQSLLSDIQATSQGEQTDAEFVIGAERDHLRHMAEQHIEDIETRLSKEIDEVRLAADKEMTELKSLEEMQFLTESHYYELKERWGNAFEAGMGAEAIYDIVSNVDLEAMAKELRVEIRTTRSKQRRKKAAKRLRVVEAFRKSGNRPEWMILKMLPVIPPDLRPMVQLDGGRFATSDLNDLYRRVINRNNRLKRLLELGAPDVIVRNEKRMLQEAVDSLVDNGRRGRAVSRSGKRKLKSLSDMLKGKQGRFRRNLLGKRVDYSGRSVIVIGPELKLHQCGLPKRMALELFKPFVMHRLVEYNYAHNIKSAKRLVDRLSPEVWDMLEEVAKERPVLLNRAPTLHRLGIQAFDVVLIEGSAIQIHPLVCAAFNADFDGDQMAVHIPLSDAAVKEAQQLMLSSKNLLLPANGEPIVGPSKDMVLGCHYMTVEKPGAKGEGRVFADFDEVALAYDLGLVDLRAKIKVRYRSWVDEMSIDELGLSERVSIALKNTRVLTIGQALDRLEEGRTKILKSVPDFGRVALEELEQALEAKGCFEVGRPKEPLLETTVGRVMFNAVLPPELRFKNRVMDKGTLKEVVAECYQKLGLEKTANLVDDIKYLGFKYVTKSGMTIAISDISVPEDKEHILTQTTAEVEEIERQYRRGLITEDEQYIKIVELWTRATDDITQAVAKELDPIESIGAMAASGATKGGIQPIRQLAGMRGLMADPAGRIIALPIRSNFREGLTALEYFLSTHGARKGLADTALRTADAGYLTRRLVDVAQDVIIIEKDCGTRSGLWFDASNAARVGETFRERILGRVAASNVVDPKSGEIIVRAGEMIEERHIEEIEKAKDEYAIPFGYDLLVREGEWIEKGTVIARQGKDQIVSRVEGEVFFEAGRTGTLARLFVVVRRIYQVHARSPMTCQTRHGLCSMCYGRDLAKGGLVQIGEAVGIIAAQSIGEPGTQLTLRTFHTGGVVGSEDITQGLPRVEELFEARVPKGKAIIAEIEGMVDIYWEDDQRKIKISDSKVVRDEYPIPAGSELLVEDGQEVEPGTVIARKKESEVVSGMKGQVFLEDDLAIVRREDIDQREYDVPPAVRFRVEKGMHVKAGEQLTEGSKDPRDILRIEGREAVQLYLLNEVQKVYRSQGVNINDKHIETIIRQMVRKVRVRSAGDTDLLPGELVDRFTFEGINEAVLADGGQSATGQTVLLGITKASLNTESFLAAASFQETTRVLTEAAVKGSRDNLRGLKENVIIGKLIPVGTGFLARQQRDARHQERLDKIVEIEG
jgi:DNA-directed RNA polymerase subunit beta'